MGMEARQVMQVNVGVRNELDMGVVGEMGARDSRGPRFVEGDGPGLGNGARAQAGGQTAGA